MNPYAAPAPRDELAQGDAAPRSGTQHLPPPTALTAGPQPRARRVTARHRKSSPSRWLVAGLALVSVLSATVITVTVDPAAPGPDGKSAQDGKSNLQSKR